MFRTEAGWWARSLGVTFAQWRPDPAIDVVSTVCETDGTPSCMTLPVAFASFGRPPGPCPAPGTSELCPHSLDLTFDDDGVVVAGRDHRDRVIHERRRVLWLNET